MKMALGGFQKLQQLFPPDFGRNLFVAIAIAVQKPIGDGLQIDCTRRKLMFFIALGLRSCDKECFIEVHEVPRHSPRVVNIWERIDQANLCAVDQYIFR